MIRSFLRFLKWFLIVGATLTAVGAAAAYVIGPMRLFFMIIPLVNRPDPIQPVDLSLAAANAKTSGVGRTLYGFTPFPYDFSLAAVTRTKDLIVPNSTVYALHFDNGIPWKAALDDGPFPSKVQKEWDDEARGIPKGHVVYLALAPLAKDRKSLAPSKGEKDNMPLPDELKDAALDDPKVKRAFLTYARRAVKTFKPKYLNIGIEAGQIMSRDMKRWPMFVNLYNATYDALKKEFPAVQIGISFGLQELMGEGQAKAAKAILARSDYVGLSFYPYASGFNEKFGAPPLETGPDAWRKPLAWIRAYTDKPIALCETGFSTMDVDLPQFDLHLKGSVDGQTAYVRDLFEITRRDRHAFVVWFLAVDYDKLYEKIKTGPHDPNLLWRNIGLLDGELRPKPAWEVWKRGVAASKKREIMKLGN